MSIIRRIQKAVNTEKEKQKESQGNQLNEYYEKIKKLGIVKKQEYNIPPIDTVGRRLYELYVVKDKEESYN